MSLVGWYEMLRLAIGLDAAVRLPGQVHLESRTTGDGKPDIVCIGASTGNVTLYEHPGK